MTSFSQPDTVIDFNHIGAIKDFVDRLKDEIQKELLDRELNAHRWAAMEQLHEAGQVFGPYGAFPEAAQVLEAARVSRQTLVTGANEIMGALTYMSDTLSRTMQAFHSVEELNSAELAGKGQQLPNFTVPGNRPASG